MTTLDRKISVHLLFFKIEGRAGYLHNATIIIGFVMIMLGGWLTVATDIRPQSEKSKRVFRLARRAGRRTRSEIINLFDI